MTSGSSSTSAYSDNDTEILHAQETKELTTIESKISVVTEKKKVKVSTKFILPHGQNVFWQ